MQITGIIIGRFTLDPYRQLLKDCAPITLGRKALYILSVLAEARGALVTKGELMEAVWPGLTVEENAIQVHIVSLRKALGDDAALLVTVRGSGYRLDTGVAITNQQESTNLLSSVAVLNFVNMTGDPQLEYLGDGVAEELINILSRNPGLKVTSRTSSFAYKHRQLDARQISSELGVGFLIEGSVRVSGDQMRVTAQLIDADDGLHILSNNFDHELSDLLVLQCDFADAIASAIDPHLGPIDTVEDPCFWGDTMPNFR